jgi:hypothetical protein
VRSVEDDTHEETTDGSGNGDGHDPGEAEKADSLPVDGAEGSVAETDTNGGTSDAHRGRDGQSILREDEDSDSGTLFELAWFSLVNVPFWSQNDQNTTESIRKLTISIEQPRDGLW